MFANDNNPTLKHVQTDGEVSVHTAETVEGTFEFRTWLKGGVSSLHPLLAPDFSGVASFLGNQYTWRPQVLQADICTQVAISAEKETVSFSTSLGKSWR